MNKIYKKKYQTAGDIKIFQEYMNNNYGTNLKVDGVIGPQTQAAYDKYVKNGYPSANNSNQSSKYSTPKTSAATNNNSQESYFDWAYDKIADIGTAAYEFGNTVSNTVNDVYNYFFPSTENKNSPKKDTFPTFGDEVSTNVLRDYHNLGMTEIGNPKATSRDSTQYVATIKELNNTNKQFNVRYDKNKDLAGSYLPEDKMMYINPSTKKSYQANYNKGITTGPIPSELSHVYDNKIHNNYQGYDMEKHSQQQQELNTLADMIRTSKVDKYTYNRLVDEYYRLEKEYYNTGPERVHTDNKYPYNDKANENRITKRRNEIETLKKQGKSWYQTAGKKSKTYPISSYIVSPTINSEYNPLTNDEKLYIGTQFKNIPIDNTYVIINNKDIPFGKVPQKSKYIPSNTALYTRAALASAQLASPNNLYLNALSAGSDLAQAIQYARYGQYPEFKVSLAQSIANFLPSIGKMGKTKDAFKNALFIGNAGGNIYEAGDRFINENKHTYMNKKIKKYQPAGPIAPGGYNDSTVLAKQYQKFYDFWNENKGNTTPIPIKNVPIPNSQAYINITNRNGISPKSDLTNEEILILYTQGYVPEDCVLTEDCGELGYIHRPPRYEFPKKPIIKESPKYYYGKNGKKYSTPIQDKKNIEFHN